jgi:hypothetical protein
MVNSFETANFTLKQKLKSTLTKMWSVATGKSDSDKSATPHRTYATDVLPPHS